MPFRPSVRGLLSGRRGLELDVVPLPRHLMELFAFDAKALRRMAPEAPEALLKQLAATRRLHVAPRLLRRCALAHVDLELHADYDAFGELSVFDLAKLIEAEYAVLRPRVQDRELCSQPFNQERGVKRAESGRK